MSRKHHTLKQLLAGVGAAILLAVIAVPTALGAHDTWYAYAVSQGPAGQQSAPAFITDTLGGNGSSQQALPFRTAYDPQQAPASQHSIPAFTTDTLGGNGSPHQASPAATGYDPQAYVPGGSAPVVAKSIQDAGFGTTASPAVVSVSSGASFDWGDAGIGAGFAVGLIVLLLVGARLINGKRGVLTA